MPTHFKPFLIIAATALHAGRGSDVGVVDLPIQREKHTEHPKIEASGIKGCLKDHYCEKLGSSNVEALKVLLGPPNGDDHASAGGFMDARILFFPVRTVTGIFAWVTCPYVLRKFKDMMALADVTIKDTGNATDDIRISEIIQNRISDEASAVTTVITGTSKDVILNDYICEGVDKDDNLAKFISWIESHFLYEMNYTALKSILGKHVVTVSDTVFSDLVRSQTEIVARVSLDDATGTVANGLLWYVEYLPEETILYSMITARKPGVTGKTVIIEGHNRKTILLDDGQNVLDALIDDDIFPKLIQLGGGYTVGKGWIRLALHKIPQAAQAGTGGA